jgi:hypothetical protein
VTTNVNIEVQDSLLLDVLKAQQANARGEFLNASSLKRLEPIARESLKRKLAAQGLNEDGLPIDRSSPQTANSFGDKNSKKQSTESRIGGEEPAANRQDSLEVARFYSKFEGGAHFLVSGDGSQEAAFSLPAPLSLPTFPILENDTPYPTFPDPTPTSFRLIAQETTRTGLTFDPNNPTIANSWNDLTQGQDKRRAVRTKSFDITRSFPLGNGTALVVRGRYFAYASVILRRSYSYTRFNDTRENAPIIFKDTLNSQSFTAELENNWTEQEDWIGVIVGKNSARQVTVPQALKEAMIREPQDTEPIEFGLASLVCNPAARNLGEFDQGTNYDEGRFQCAGWPGVYGYEVYAINFEDRVPLILSAPSPLSNERNPDTASSSQAAYGLTFDGQQYSDDLSTSPSSWFNVDSREVDEQIEQASTHESLYAVSLSDGRSFGELFKRRSLVNLDRDGLRWNGPNLQDDVYTFPDSNNSNWKKKIKFAPRDLLEGDLELHYVYDWGQRAFCQQQAARYGITL